MNFSYSIESRETCKIVSITGSISVTSIESFERLISSLTDIGNVIINMEKVESVTSSGLNTLIDIVLSAKSKNHRVLLLRPGKLFLEMIEIVRDYDYFNIIETVDEGLAKLKFYT
ncbi:MAG: STAS domain-containing protein [Spirochaetes bacterium]|nr:STAS domain-containing protein [Spirochaetota bacterium]